MSVECGEMTPKTLIASWRHTSTWWAFGAKKGRRKQQRKQQRPSLSIRESWHEFDENENELKWFIITQRERTKWKRERKTNTFIHFLIPSDRCHPFPSSSLSSCSYMYVRFYQSTRSASQQAFRMMTMLLLLNQIHFPVIFFIILFITFRVRASLHFSHSFQLLARVRWSIFLCTKREQHMKWLEWRKNREVLMMPTAQVLFWIIMLSLLSHNSSGCVEWHLKELRGWKNSFRACTHEKLIKIFWF